MTELPFILFKYWQLIVVFYIYSRGAWIFFKIVLTGTGRVGVNDDVPSDWGPGGLIPIYNYYNNNSVSVWWWFCLIDEALLRADWMTSMAVRVAPVIVYMLCYVTSNNFTQANVSFILWMTNCIELHTFHFYAHSFSTDTHEWNARCELQSTRHFFYSPLWRHSLPIRHCACFSASQEHGRVWGGSCVSNRKSGELTTFARCILHCRKHTKIVFVFSYHTFKYEASRLVSLPTHL